MFPPWIYAFSWGFFAGAALIIGALIAWFIKLSPRVIASIMAFGSGVLISALSFELMEAAADKGGILFAAAGFLIGAFLYTFINWLLAFKGAKHRKRSNNKQPSEEDQQGSGTAIAAGALLDGIPESIVIGISLLNGAGVNLITVLAIFLSNIPEGLSSAAGMKKAGRSPSYIFLLWSGIAVSSALASLAGFLFFKNSSPTLVALINALAAGAILAMIVDTMIPEAFEETHSYAGLITVGGFLLSFILSNS